MDQKKAAQYCAALLLLLLLEVFIIIINNYNIPPGYKPNGGMRPRHIHCYSLDGGTLHAAAPDTRHREAYNCYSNKLGVDSPYNKGYA